MSAYSFLSAAGSVDLHEQEAVEGDKPRKGAACTLAKPRDSHKSYNDHNEPEDNLHGVEDRIRLEAPPLPEPIDLVGEQLVDEENDALDGLLFANG
jgi:hypothetical protein